MRDFFLAALLAAALLAANVAVMSTDFGCSVYCFGKIDRLDPWC